MKSFFLLCSLLLIANLSFAVDCKLVVTNTTAYNIVAGAQTTTSTPNECPAIISSEASDLVLAGTTSEILLGSVPYGVAPIRPFRIGAGLDGGGMESWQINTCWNPTCVYSSGPFTITITYCSDYEVHVTIS